MVTSRVGEPERGRTPTRGRRRPPRRLLVPVAVLLVAIATGVGPAAAQDQVPLEYQVKAAFLYQFLSFVEWPAAALAGTRDTMVVGVVGETPMAAALEPLAGKPVRGRSLVVRPLRDLKSPGVLHVLFAGASARNRVASALQAVKGTSVLTIGETEGFARLGGMINFVIVDGKVRFEINPRAAEEAQLRISSKLLRLARIVEEKG